MPRPRTSTRTPSQITLQHRRRALEAGGRRLTVVLRPEAAVALQRLTGDRHGAITALINQMLIEWAR